MASRFSAVCFVRCPKCLRVLAESPDIPLFKCYSCDAILNDNGLANASDEPKKLEQDGAKRHEDGEETFEEAESAINGTTTLSFSGSSEEKRDSAVYEPNGFNSSYELEEQSPESSEHEIKDKEGDEGPINSIGFGWKIRNPNSYDRSFSVSDKQRRVQVTQKHSAVSRRTRSSHSYDRSFSSSNEHRRHDHVPQKHLALSRRTRSRKVLDSADGIEAGSNAEEHCSKFSIQSSTNGVQAEELSLISQSKDELQVAKLRFSETDDQTKILEKVDELKIELHRLFSDKSAGKEASNFSIMVTHFEGKIESNDDRSSLFRFLRRPGNSSCLLDPNGNRRLCQESQARHCRPVSGGAPFVICYKCYKLLQLPADFLVSTKRVHKLRCGSCSEVLVYSFRPRSRAAINKRF